MKTKLKYLLASTSFGVLTFTGFKSNKGVVHANEIDGFDISEYYENGGQDSISRTIESTTGEPSTTAGFFKGYNPVTEDNLKTGSYWATPIVDFLGNLVGFGMALIMIWVVVQTVIDLLYWAIPTIRPLLEPQQSGALQGGMNGMGGAQQQRSKIRITVSDDMTQSLGGGVQQGGMMQPQGQYGGGGLGGGLGVGYNTGGQQQQEPKHVLTTYFKKRVLSLIILGVCAAVLLSSLLIDTGINVGAFIVKLINIFNEFVTSNT